MDPTLIEKFILDELACQNMTFEDKRELLETFSETIFLAAVLEAAKKLDSENRGKLESIIELGDQKIVANFLIDKVSNFDDILTSESLKFKQSLIDRFKKHKTN